MNGDGIEYSRLPGQNGLFLSYLDDREETRGWYALTPGLEDSVLLEHAQRTLSTPHLDRDRLLSALSQTQQLLGNDDSRKLQTRLAASDCVAVVTGQQVGLFGGPAYSVYKAVTAIRLAKHLERLGQPAVPVFWLASDDSDFAEVRSTFLAPGDQLLEIRYPERPAEGQMAGPVTLADIDRLYEGMGADLDLRELRRCYRPDVDFRQAFGSWMTHIFRNEELLFFDPLAEGYRAGIEPLLRRAITQRDEIVARLLERGRELKASGFGPQVHVDDSESLLFWVDEGRRFKLEFVNGHYKAKGKPDLKADPEELLARLAAEPGSLSGSALLRPLLQEYILPTFATIGGPGEIAYFSQVAAIAPIWELRPAVLPRASFTIVDRQVQRLLDRYGFSAEQFLTEDPSTMTELLLRGLDVGSALERLDTLRNSLTDQLKGVRTELGKHDASVASMLETGSRKMLYQLDKVRSRFIANSSQSNATVRRHIDVLNNRLRPQGGLQERLLNFSQFLVEDPGLVGKLVDAAEPHGHQHQIVYL